MTDLMITIKNHSSFCSIKFYSEIQMSFVLIFPDLFFLICTRMTHYQKNLVKKN